MTELISNPNLINIHDNNLSLVQEINIVIFEMVISEIFLKRQIYVSYKAKDKLGWVENSIKIYLCLTYLTLIWFFLVWT